MTLVEASMTACVQVTRGFSTTDLLASMRGIALSPRPSVVAGWLLGLVPA